MYLLCKRAKDNRAMDLSYMSYYRNQTKARKKQIYGMGAIQTSMWTHGESAVLTCMVVQTRSSWMWYMWITTDDR